MKKLYVRPELCTGCRTCELACAVEHSRSKNLLGAMIESPPPHPRLYVEAVSAFPVRVLQDAHDLPPLRPRAVHRRVHPQVDASQRPGGMWSRTSGGKHACIACGMCVMTCPFGMIGGGRRGR